LEVSKRLCASFVLATLLAIVSLVLPRPSRTLAEYVDTSLYGSGDTLVIAGLGINAPVNTRNVGDDGKMGDPAGKDDVVRYDFPTMPELGGYPGMGGTTVLAGHVDYHPNFTAVFWTLRQATVGMQIDYYRSDGVWVSYAIDWISSSSGDGDIAEYLVSTSPESMVLISCEGTFDPSTLHYNNRTLVHATRIS